MLRTLRSEPKKYRARLSPDGMILQFRHPLVMDADGRGAVCRVGVGKLSPSKRGKLLEQTEKLLAIAPMTRDEAPECGELVLDVYMRRIDEVTAEPPEVQEESLPEQPYDPSLDRQEIARKGGNWEDAAQNLDQFQRQYTPTKMRRITITEADGSVRQFDYMVGSVGEQEAVAAVMETATSLRQALTRERKEKANLRRRIEELQRAMGARTDTEMAFTLKACMEHFRETLKATTKHKVLHRVGLLIEKLGSEMTWADLTSGKIVEALDALDEERKSSETERSYRLRDFKRFCKAVCMPRQHDGLGLVTNPCEVLKNPSTITFAKRRIDREGVRLLDPAEIVTNENIEPYWRALVAVMGYAGARLSETTTLRWRDIAFKDKLLHLQPDPMERPDSKNFRSRRPVAPFSNLWPILRKFKPKNAKPNDWVFPNPEGACWLKEKHGRPSAHELSFAFVRAVEKDVPEKNRAYALRHFWETAMRKAGLGDLVHASGGHAEQVGRLYYTDNLELAKAAAKKGMPKAGTLFHVKKVLKPR